MGRLAAVAAIVAVAIAACGESSEKEPSAAQAPRHQTPTITQPGEANGSLAQVKQRLRAAGYSPAAEEVSGTAVSALAVKDVQVVGYRSAADAATDARGIRSVFAKAPARGVVRVVGTRIYWMAQERSLTSAERDTFTKVLAAGEGKR